MALLTDEVYDEPLGLDDLTMVILNVECRDGTTYSMLVESGDGYMWLEEVPDPKLTPQQEARTFRIVRSDEPHP